MGTWVDNTCPHSLIVKEKWPVHGALRTFPRRVCCRSPTPPGLGFAAGFPSLCNTPVTAINPGTGDTKGTAPDGAEGGTSLHDEGRAGVRADRRHRAKQLDASHGADRVRARAVRPNRKIPSRALRGRGRYTPGGVRPGGTGTRCRRRRHARGVRDGAPPFLVAPVDPGAGRDMVSRRRAHAVLPDAAQARRVRRIPQGDLLRRRPRLRLRGNHLRPVRARGAGALGRPRGHARSRARALRTAVPQRTAPALHRPDGLRPRRDRGRRTRAHPPRPDRDRPRRPCRALFRRERDPRGPAPCRSRLLPHPAGRRGRHAGPAAPGTRARPRRKRSAPP
jgi:hypothetical protein